MLASESKDHQHVELCQHCQIMQGFLKLTKSYSHFASKKLQTNRPMADTRTSVYGEQWLKIATESRD